MATPVEALRNAIAAAQAIRQAASDTAAEVAAQREKETAQAHAAAALGSRPPASK